MTALEFTKPGPGSWALDRAHCHRPRAHFIHETAEWYTESFRAGFAHYGVLLDTIELAYVHGFPYICVRPLGAPPDSSATPPKLLIQLLSRLHPTFRRRNRRAREVFATKAWREDLREFHDDFFPKLSSRLSALQSVVLSELDDDAVLSHVEAAQGAAADSLRHHFRISPSYMIPVGDFLAQVMAWTGASASEVLLVFRGSSPYSRDAADLAAAAAAAVAASAPDSAVLHSDEPPDEILSRLRAADGEVGRAVGAWIDVVGHRIFTGYDIDALTGLEAPGALIRCLRSAADADPSDAAAEADAVKQTLRERVPESHRDEYDVLLEEACAVYGLRDAHSCGCETWTLGVTRQAVLEAGRRLQQRGCIQDEAHALDLSLDELTNLLRGATEPSLESISARAAARARLQPGDAPEFLGPPPGEPPPASWLPGPSARLQRAISTYLEAISEGRKSAHADTVVRGQGASAGRYIGPARVINGPEDFDRIREGDVLVTTITTPSYNLLLPLLRGVVTDRGGILSHPAIVAREYGIPGVVGTRDATRRITDGARVDVDGDAGTVTVLS